MYVALFLTPWVLMYALSTFAMNHRHALNAERAPEWRQISNSQITTAMTADPEPKLVGEAVLESLGLSGRFNVQQREAKYVIQRQNLLTPQRLTFAPATGQVVVEELPFRWPAFLERFHRRRGYEAGQLLDNGWAVTVDFFIVAVVGWVLSGLWMWWGLRPTRGWGAIVLGGGIALFTFFLFSI